MKRLLHLVKVKFLGIKWYFDRLYFAQKHAKAVKNYEFLIGIRAAAHERFLEIDRESNGNPDHEKLKVQIELLDKIIGYVG